MSNTKIVGTQFVTLVDPWATSNTKYYLGSLVEISGVTTNSPKQYTVTQADAYNVKVETPTKKVAREYGVRKKEYETTPTRERKARLSPAQRLLNSKSNNTSS